MEEIIQNVLKIGGGGADFWKDWGIPASVKIAGERERTEVFHPWSALSPSSKDLLTQDEYRSEGKAASWALKNNQEKAQAWRLEKSCFEHQAKKELEDGYSFLKLVEKPTQISQGKSGFLFLLPVEVCDFRKDRWKGEMTQQLALKLVSKNRICFSKPRLVMLES